MQKKLIALAVAAAAGSAFAQTNVTLYGIADAYYANASAKTTTTSEKFSGVNSGGLSTSRLGFRGTEDLGNGLKALFTLEYGLTLDQNATIGASTGATTTAFSARQQFVGLSGGFGTVVAGRLQTPWLDHEVKYSPLPGSALLDPLYIAKNGAWNNTAVALGTDRADNTVAYISPNMSGVTLKVAQSFAGEVKGNNPVVATGADIKQNASLLSADYDNGPLSVGGVYRIVSDQTTNAATTQAGNKQWTLGAAYNLNVAKLFATYQSGKFDSLLGTTDAKVSSYSLGVSVPVSAAGTVVLGMANTKDKNIAAGVYGAKAYTLAYTHALSKRTTAYAGYTLVDGKADTAVTSTVATTLNASNDKKASTIAFGLRHSF